MKLTLSLVSHNQSNLVETLVNDLFQNTDLSQIDHELIISINIPESEITLCENNNLNIKVYKNTDPKGFGENHNHNFLNSDGDYFIILNPDLRIEQFSFSKNIAKISKNVGAYSVMIKNALGQREDSARKFPTPLNQILRFITNNKDQDYNVSTDSLIEVDWLAGMFIIFQSKAFKSLKGFDEKFFMYMEDTDICRRLKKQGYKVIYDPSTSVIHDARRDSRKKSKYFFYHLSSLLKYYLS